MTKPEKCPDCGSTEVSAHGCNIACRSCKVSWISKAYVVDGITLAFLKGTPREKQLIKFLKKLIKKYQ